MYAAHLKTLLLTKISYQVYPLIATIIFNLHKLSAFSFVIHFVLILPKKLSQKRCVFLEESS